MCLFYIYICVDSSNIKLARRMVIDQHELCEHITTDYEYDRSVHLCVNESMAPCKNDVSVMAVDRSIPDKPFWYLFGIVLSAPLDCVDTPKIIWPLLPTLKSTFTIFK